MAIDLSSAVLGKSLINLEVDEEHHNRWDEERTRSGIDRVAGQVQEGALPRPVYFDQIAVFGYLKPHGFSPHPIPVSILTRGLS